MATAVAQKEPTNICYVNENPGTEPLTEEESKALAHYNSLPRRLRRLYYKKGIREDIGYGVQQTWRILAMGLFHKQHDEICRFLLSLGSSHHRQSQNQNQ